MAPPQGLCTFPGLNTITSASFTLSHGIRPSVATIQTVPQANYVAEVGTLEFAFGKTRLRFPQSRVNFASLQVSQGGQLWTLQVLDRRWKWEFGEISGWYNRRTPDGEIDKDREKTPQELAKLLLEAMGERGYDVSQLPDKARPEVLWDSATPADELASLCDQFSCRVVLGLDDRVRVCKVGKGRQLPSTDLDINRGFGFASGSRPDSIKVKCAPLLFQSKLKLQAVGKDTDGQIKPIDKLSYKPTANNVNGANVGFFREPNLATWPVVSATYVRDGQTLKASDLAVESVFRWYRVVSEADGKLDFQQLTSIVPKGDDDEPQEKVKRIEQVYPLGTELLEQALDPDGILRPKGAFVEGSWWTGGSDFANVDPWTIYTGDFQIKGELGLVIFKLPVVKINATTNLWEEPDLYLTTTYSINSDKTGLPIRTYVSRKMPGRKLGTGPRIIPHPEIQIRVRTIYEQADPAKAKGIRFNKTEAEREADYYLDAVEAEYRLEPSKDIQYAGLVAIEPDGAIAQVSWQVGGNGPAVTRASRNTEFNLYVPSFKERRRQEQVDAQLKKEKLKKKEGKPSAPTT